jgi:hypothetical protein
MAAFTIQPFSAIKALSAATSTVIVTNRRGSAVTWT